MNIAVVSRNPPGGRCTLYLRYADRLTAGKVPFQVIHAAAEAVNAPPALLINGAPLLPVDSFMLEPGEVQAAAIAAGFEGDALVLLAELEAVYEEQMLVWANGAK